MHGYLKGYYGYKNFGDEVLLLGIIPRLFTNTDVTFLSIEADDVSRLQERLTRHNNLPSLLPYSSQIAVVPKHAVAAVRPDHLFFGGGEVLTDGRPFPYNGRNHLFRYFSWIMSGNYTLLGGIGTPKKILSSRLRKLLLSHTDHVIVREKHSYDVALHFTQKDHITLYHDFALDILTTLPDVSHREAQSIPQVLLNINPYIRSAETKEKLRQIAKTHRGESFRFFPAEYGVDDRYLDELKQLFPNIQLFDWQNMHIDQIVKQISTFSFGVAARLHVLVLLRFLQIPFEPLIYQEKITTFLQTCFDESSSSSL